MPQTISVTEARDNFPALVRRVAEQDEAVVVTSHNQPKAVLMRWETYQAQQQAQSEGALSSGPLSDNNGTTRRRFAGSISSQQF
jgi:prevent-host-death family protein